MRKSIFIFLSFLLIGAMVATGSALAASSIVVAQDTPPRMMNPHGDDSDAGLQYMANFFDGLLQRTGPGGKAGTGACDQVGASRSSDMEVLPQKGCQVS